MFSRSCFGNLARIDLRSLDVKNVLSRPETESLRGSIWFGYLLEGMVYGVIDGLLLSPFRGLSRGELLRSKRGSWAENSIWISGMALHSCNDNSLSRRLCRFRSKKIIQPNIGNTIISIQHCYRQIDRFSNNSCDNAHRSNYSLS